MENALKDPSQRSNQCADPKFKKCNDAAEHECAGYANMDYMFSLSNIANAEESMQHIYRI